MNCGSCGQSNPDGARFCNECASRREHYLREAHRLFTEMSATGNAERLARELASRA